MKGAEAEGNHGRLFHHGGSFDPREILMREIHGEYQRYIDGKMVWWIGKEFGAILVAGTASVPIRVTSLIMLVSTQADLRDDIRTLVQAHVYHNVRFLELEYQP